jgi:zinc transport system substrate-binding protein
MTRLVSPVRAWMLVGLAVLVQGCGSSTGPGENGPSGSGPPIVHVTSYPLAYFASRIGGDTIEIRFLAGVSGDPAYWKPKPEDVSTMQKAELILQNGAGYERWMKQVSLPSSRLVDTTAGLRDRLLPLEEDLSHSHGPEGAHRHGGTAFTTWLDPRLAIAQAAAVRAAFSRRWPRREASFAAGFEALRADLQALDDELERIRATPGKPRVIFSHPVFQYLAARCDLKARSVHWEPDQAPTEAMWKELERLQEESPATWMIWEGSPLPAIRARLEAMGLRSLVYQPCGNRPEEGDFLSVMRASATELGKALAPRADSRSSTETGSG